MLQCFAEDFKLDIVKALHREEQKLAKYARLATRNLETLRSTIKLFSNTTDGRHRTMSKAAKAKISTAQKARWAKWAGGWAKPKLAGRKRRKMSQVARIKISVAQKARWARHAKQARPK
jgi:hypothetical protein